MQANGSQQAHEHVDYIHNIQVICYMHSAEVGVGMSCVFNATFTSRVAT
jgi:hypothetical protein